MWSPVHSRHRESDSGDAPLSTVSAATLTGEARLARLKQQALNGAAQADTWWRLRDRQLGGAGLMA